MSTSVKKVTGKVFAQTGFELRKRKADKDVKEREEQRRERLEELSSEKVGIMDFPVTFLIERVLQCSYRSMKFIAYITACGSH